MNKESLCNLPTLVNFMDENLSININDFINNEILSQLQLNQAQLIDIIKSSNKFHYDNKNSLIKFKEKADRNILIIANFVNTDERKEKEEFVRKLISDFNSNYIKEIKKIDLVGDSFHVVFQNEDISMDVEKYLIALLQKEPSSEENSKYFNELQRANICLAAESLKRRVLTNLITNPQWKQVQFVNKIIGSFVQRKYTVTEKAHKNLRRDSEINTARIFHQKSMHIHNKNYIANCNSKFPFFHHKDSFVINVNETNNSDKMFNNLSNKHQTNSKVLHNKFDLGQEQLAFIRQTSNDEIVRRLSFRTESFFSVVNDEAMKMPLPLNKEYEVNLEKNFKAATDIVEARN
jgi:hypothetical protein